MRSAWSGFHTRVVLALGITWILDGLEVTLAGALSGALKQSPTLHFSNFDVGFANSAYLAGAVLGALGFGWLTDRIGRKKLFFITLALYLTATAATALSWSVASYALFRFLTGAGIGGEYTAINSTIQELVPARYRGWTDLVINGSFWIGAAIGAVSAIVLLDPAVAGPDLGWRLAYLTGAVSRPDRAGDADVDSGKPALADDPRPAGAGAQAIVADIEQIARRTYHATAQPLPKIKLADARSHAASRSRAHAVLDLSPALAGRARADGRAGVLLQRDLLHLRAGADRFLRHRRPTRSAGTSCRSPPAISSGPLLLGRLFDTLGRRTMITLTYGVSGVLLALSGYLFSIGALSAQSQTIAWMVIFFFASPAASAAYLTVSETFPLEVRALAIALFYAVGTGIGGVAGPALFGALIDTGSRTSVFAGYLFGRRLMVAAAAVALALCASRPSASRSKSVARPLAFVE